MLYGRRENKPLSSFLFVVGKQTNENSTAEADDEVEE